MDLGAKMCAQTEHKFSKSGWVSCIWYEYEYGVIKALSANPAPNLKLNHSHFIQFWLIYNQESVSMSRDKLSSPPANLHSLHTSPQTPE